MLLRKTTSMPTSAMRAADRASWQLARAHSSHLKHMPLRPPTTSAMHAQAPLPPHPVDAHAQSGASTESDEDLDSEHQQCGISYDPECSLLGAWVYAAETRGSSTNLHRAVFQRRYCKLHELVVLLFDPSNPHPDARPPLSTSPTSSAAFPADPSDADGDGDADIDAAELSAFSRYVVVSVERVADRNKTFKVTDTQGQHVLVHPTRDVDFEQLFSAFRAIVRSAQRAIRERAVVRRKRGVTMQAPASASMHMHLPDRMSRAMDQILMDRLRSATDPPQAIRLGGNAAMVFEPDPERTYAAWLYLERAWWRSTRYVRRYFVLSGVTLSCFEINRAGQRAEFTRQLVGCQYEPEQSPCHAELLYASGSGSLRVCMPMDERETLRDFIDRLKLSLVNCAYAGRTSELVLVGGASYKAPSRRPGVFV